MALSGDGRRLVVSAAGRVAALAAADGRTEWARPPSESRATVLIQAVDRDGRRALLRKNSGSIELVDLGDGSTRWSASGGACAFSPGETRVLACGASGDLLVLDARTGERIVSLPAKSGPLVLLASSPDGESVVALSNLGVPILWRGAPSAVGR